MTKRLTQLEELQQFISDERLQEPEMLAALEAQGIDTSGLSESPETVDVTDAESPDAQLAELEQESDQLQETHQEQLQRDKLRQQESFKASQQRAADELQRTLGSIQQVRQDTTSGVRTRVNAVADRLGSMATPGGIGVPLTILLALLVFLIPVMTKNGESEPRFIWAWKVLTRKAQLLPETEIATSSHEKTTAASNGSGNSGAGSASTADEAASVLALPSLSTSNFSQYFRG